MSENTKRSFTLEQARELGEQLGIDFNIIDLEQFRLGFMTELEHGSHDPETNVTNDDPVMTGKIAWAHLKEISDYYNRLEKMEASAKKRAEEQDDEKALSIVYR